MSILFILQVVVSILVYAKKDKFEFTENDAVILIILAIGTALVEVGEATFI